MSRQRDEARGTLCHRQMVALRVAHSVGSSRCSTVPGTSPAPFGRLPCYSAPLTHSPSRPHESSGLESCTRRGRGEILPEDGLCHQDKASLKTFPLIT